jgi:nucleoside-diphosphate-sugar epimerase
VRDAGADPAPGDLSDEAALRAAMEGCDVAFHAAARVDQWGRLEDFLHDNVGGTERVLSAARAGGVRRVVHVSTEAVLAGGRKMHQADETWPRPRRPVGLYPLTKGLAEERVLAANGRELETVIARPRLIWGKGDTSVLPKIAQGVREGRFAWIGGGRFLTSTCHVRNVCEGLIKAAERGQPGAIYFLTDGAPVQMREFLGALLRTQGVEPGDRALPFCAAYAAGAAAELVWRALRRRGEPPVTRMAVLLGGEEVTVRDDKARREIGYVGAVTREQGLAEMASP